MAQDTNVRRIQCEDNPVLAAGNPGFGRRVGEGYWLNGWVDI
jgi:hypothetical protein